MPLDLKNPILFFDIESTGLNIATDRIVEISVVKILPTGEKEIKTRRINPTIPISPEAMKIHKISNEDVANSPTFKEVAKSLANFMAGCDIAGYNSTKFDIPLLAEEFLRAGIDFDFRKRKIVDVQVIFHKMEPRNLAAAYQFYCGKNLENAHSAEADTIATYEILDAQVDKYPDLKNDINFLSEFSSKTKNADYAGRMIFDENGEILFNFGKHKGKKVSDVLEKYDPNYYSWMMQGDFTLDTKRVLSEIKMKLK